MTYSNKVLFIIMSILCSLVALLVIYCKQLQQDVHKYKTDIEQLELQLDKSNKLIEVYNEAYKRDINIRETYESTTQTINAEYNTNDNVKSWCDTTIPIELQCVFNNTTHTE